MPDVLSGVGLLLLQAVLQGVLGRQAALPVCSKTPVMHVGICLLPLSMLKLILAFISLSNCSRRLRKKKTQGLKKETCRGGAI